jgi:hypothetical protein
MIVRIAADLAHHLVPKSPPVNRNDARRQDSGLAWVQGHHRGETPLMD